MQRFILGRFNPLLSCNNRELNIIIQSEYIKTQIVSLKRKKIYIYHFHTCMRGINIKIYLSLDVDVDVKTEFFSKFVIFVQYDIAL